MRRTPAALACSLALCACAATASAPPPSVADRLASRAFPSVFMPWNNIDPLPGDELEAVARHDLMWHNVMWFGLEFDTASIVEWNAFTPASIEAARRKIDRLRALNPGIVVLSEMRYRDAPDWALPEDHALWLRDEAGERVMSWPEGGYLRLDEDSPELRAMVARQSRVLMETGLFDGLFFDWWFDAEPSRLRLMEAVREAVPEETVIVVNANDNPIPNTAHLVNGSFMECWESADWGTWGRIEETLLWLEAHTREPRLNALSTWYETGRDELDRVRATTTLSMTRSDGFALFTDPNDLPTPDHRHDWYPFWDADLGRPLAPGVEHDEGGVRREFEGGLAVYNRPGGAPAVVRFDAPHRSLATGVVATEHRVPAADGDLFVPATGPGSDP